MEPYIVYIRTDDMNRIEAVNSSMFISDLTSWIEIDHGFDVKHRHAQGNYFLKPLFDERGIHRYITGALFDNKEREAWHIFEYNGEQWGIYERTQEEMDADHIAPEPATDDGLTGRVIALEAQLAAYEAAYAQGVNDA